ncbi:YggT family protein [Parasphaerochaeta coccoides]|uniref:YGGT family protein n=1 Tax=Parasphaerochaeta coccoides (strain ATCC BAA-1237 / DSM 17374 / SPN1) TaxID=760011 RepID=F4GLV3_PARC1|nr:YggT family protein [Parasphaerochaeta coccoides]AEC02994.1 protein of unknown function YGGT [Parasphaerochaeta coccoides DSM 17374]
MPVYSNHPTFLMNLALTAAGVISIYSLVIWLRIIMTWMRSPSFQAFSASPFFRFIASITDPYLRLFSGVKFLKLRRIDLTPLMALLALNLARSILTLFGNTGILTLGMVLALLIRMLWQSLFNPAFIFFLILLIIRLVFCYRRTPNSSNYVMILDSALGWLFNGIQRRFYKDRIVPDRTLVIASLVALLVTWAVSFLLVILLANLVTRIPF